jgi:ATP-binding cassette subfamily B protein
MIKQQNNKKLLLINTIIKVVSMIFRASPVFFILFALVAILHGVSWAITVVVTQRFFDAVQQVIKNNESIKIAIYALVWLAIVVIGSEIVNGLHSFVYTPFNQISIGYLMQKIHLKIADIDPIEYENPEVLDNINKANEGIQNIFGMAFTCIMIFTFFLPYIIFMEIYLFSLKPILSISIILFALPVIISQLLRVGIFSKLEDEVAPIRREVDYYEQCICGREYFKETRILGAFNFFNGLYEATLLCYKQKLWKTEKRAFLMDLSTKIITLLGYLGVLSLLINALISKEISVGKFAALFASLGQLLNMIQGVISSSGDMGKNLVSITNFFDFLNMPQRQGKDTNVNFKGGISLDNVTFHYPKAQQNALKNVSINIAGGETVAIVGENGAGKTTFVRLLTGIYLPTEGTVKFGGVDTKTVAPEALFTGISGVFQKYQHYEMTLRDNIRISHIEEKFDNDKLGVVIKKADINMETETFPEGLNTMLSRDFDGVDLSGGQWQRIAIARGYFRHHEIIVLDEPTAAIDPIEESKIYSKFSDLSKGKTSILVTHRLGAARIADRIIVMDKGQIVEIGSHEELIQKKGKYFNMFTAQAQWYEMSPIP